MPAQGQKSWDGFAAERIGRSQCLPSGRNPGTCRNACPGAEILGREPRGSIPQTASQCLPRGRNPGTVKTECCTDSSPPEKSQCLPRGRNPGTALARASNVVAMPAQGQKSWDAYTLSFRNACPGAEILGRPRRFFVWFLSRFAMPAQGQKSWDWTKSMVSSYLVRVAMPAQGQKSWDQSLMTSGGRTLMVAMPAQGQKSWDEVSCCDFLAASVVAMSAQGQKSWDGATRRKYNTSQCLPRGRNPGTSYTNTTPMPRRKRR